MTRSRTGRLLVAAVASLFMLAQVPVAALADGRGRGHHKHHGHHGYDKRGKHDHYRGGVVIVRPGHHRFKRHRGYYGHRGHYGYRGYDRHRHYRGHRHYGGHRYVRKHRRYDDAYVFFGLGAVTLGLFALLNQQQRDAHYRSQSYATTAPVGRTVIWNDGGASGNVVVTRDGRDRAGRYCREFQHTVTIAGKRQQAWGTACQQPNGDWQIVD